MVVTYLSYIDKYTLNKIYNVSICISYFLQISFVYAFIHSINYAFTYSFIYRIINSLIH